MVWSVFLYIVKITLAIIAVLVLCVSFYIACISLNIRIPIPLNNVEEEEIYKSTVKRSDLKDETYIICRKGPVGWGHYSLIQDENGKRKIPFIERPVFVTGDVGYGGILDFDFQFFNEHYVFYVVEKKVRYCPLEGKELPEYIVDGWDILYPAKRLDLFETAPSYILKSDLNKNYIEED